MSFDQIFPLIFWAGFMLIGLFRFISGPRGAELRELIASMLGQDTDAATPNNTQSDAESWTVLDQEGNPVAGSASPNSTNTQIQNLFDGANFDFDREEIEENVGRVLWWGLGILIFVALLILVPVALITL